MTYPDAITITRASTTAVAVDTESGMPTAALPTVTTVYDGSAFVQEDERLTVVTADGNVVRASDARVFLPPGEHGVMVEDEITAGGRTGRVIRVSLFTIRFYTELQVKWQQQ